MFPEIVSALGMRGYVPSDVEHLDTTGEALAQYERGSITASECVYRIISGFIAARAFDLA